MPRRICRVSGAITTALPPSTSTIWCGFRRGDPETSQKAALELGLEGDGAFVPLSNQETVDFHILVDGGADPFSTSGGNYPPQVSNDIARGVIDRANGKVPA
jgi:hypothetical protein